MDELRARVNAPVLSAEDAGWDGDAMEAEALRLSGDALEEGFAAVTADDHRCASSR